MGVIRLPSELIMPLGPMPPNNQGGAPSPQQGPPPQQQVDPFAQFVNTNSYVPVWLHPHVAAGVIRHFGRDGSAIVHPHPTLGANGGAMRTGGVAPTGQVAPMQRPAAQTAGAPAAAAAAAAGRGGTGAPLAGLSSRVGAVGDAGRSIFGGGQVGAGGPMQRVPVFAQRGGALDARAGVKVPGQTPAPDAEHDTVNAMLDPGEAVFNTKQLAGIKPKPGKEHLLRADQKNAMKKASNARRK